ncbi:MAG TPA: hypothetical protein VHZ24_10125 [Pirellulales bacterium]|nr:hypothetical protein [Pirellulales bacterium]
MMVSATAKGGGWSVLIKLPRNSGGDETAELSVTLRNEGAKRQMAGAHELPGICRAALIAKDGRPCRFTPIGRYVLGDALRVGSGSLGIIEPGKEHTWRTDLTRCFEFSTGEFELQFSIELPPIEPGPAVVIKLPPVKFHRLG